MKKLVIWLMLCLCQMFAMAQTMVTITGHVSDEKGHRISSASIIADDGRTATVANDNGYFVLQIPSSVRHIRVSHLGYSSQDVDVSANPEVQVKLHTKAIMLGDVLIGDPKDILLLALKNIRDNYMVVPALQKCFYRETTRKGSRYIYVAEAVTHLYKTGYQRTIDYDKTAILKARRLISTQMKDTLGAKIAGGPVTPIILDLVKNQTYLLNEEVLNLYAFAMRPAPTLTDGRSEVIITIKPKYETAEALLLGDIYIDTQSLAIRYMDLELDMSDKDKATHFMLQQKPAGVRFKPLGLKIQVSYRPDRDGKLFLGYIRSDIDFKCDWKRKLFSSGYHVTSEMVVTDLRTDSVKTIKGKSTFSRQESLYDHPEYFGDPTFWQQYNIIAPTESLRDGIDKFIRKEKR